MSNLTFAALRAANIARLPQFKDAQGRLAHPPKNDLQLEIQKLLDDSTSTVSSSGAVSRWVDRAITLLQNVFKLDMDWSLGEWVMACAGELGELANFVKKVRRGDMTLDEARADIAKEAADVQIYLDLLCNKAGIDLGAAVLEKFNEVSHRVGSDVALSARSAEPWVRIRRLMSVEQRNGRSVPAFDLSTVPAQGRLVLLKGPSGMIAPKDTAYRSGYYDAEFRPLSPFLNEQNDCLEDEGIIPTHWKELP